MKQKQTYMSNRSLSSFFGEMAEILQAGISSMEGLSILQEDAKDEGEKQMLQSIYDGLLSTGSFYQGMAAAECFPPYAMQMVELGEQTGRLDDVVASLGTYYKREEDVAKAVKNAVLYPLVMVAMMLVIVLVLLIKVLPVFQQVFQQLGMEMNVFSTGLLRVGQLMGRYSVVFVLLAVVIIVLVLLAAMGRLKKSGISEQMALCRFASGMAMTLSSGLPQEQSLELVSELVQNDQIQEKIKKSQEHLSEGDSLAEAIAKEKIFSGLYARMITIGSHAGSLEEAMDHIAELYQDEIDEGITRKIAMIEPTLVAVLSIITGVILLSVMLPLLGILSSL